MSKLPEIVSIGGIECEVFQAPLPMGVESDVNLKGKQVIISQSVPVYDLVYVLADAIAQARLALSRAVRVVGRVE